MVYAPSAYQLESLRRRFRQTRAHGGVVSESEERAAYAGALDAAEARSIQRGQLALQREGLALEEQLGTERLRLQEQGLEYQRAHGEDVLDMEESAAKKRMFADVLGAGSQMYGMHLLDKGGYFTAPGTTPAATTPALTTGTPALTPAQEFGPVAASYGAGQPGTGSVAGAYGQPATTTTAGGGGSAGTLGPASGTVPAGATLTGGQAFSAALGGAGVGMTIGAATSKETGMAAGAATGAMYGGMVGGWPGAFVGGVMGIIGGAYGGSK